MAKAKLTVRVEVKDIDRFRLFVWELRMLVDRMRVEASPHSAALESLLDRFTDGGNDDRPEEAA